MKGLTPLLCLGSLPLTCLSAAAEHIKADHTHEFELALPTAEAFTFFEPIGEKRWAAGWQPAFATPVDATLHNGSVFTVDHPPSPGAPTSRSIWTITRYEAPELIEYHHVLPGVRATRITVQVASVTPMRSRVRVRYVYTGLSDAGDEAIRRITPEAYRGMIAGWGTEIAAYLGRGTPASP
ncbi:hypothetical protein Verru16b_00042 [Lacunisphaera limnophila]|uniref:Polyketide cyclase / dehydrase and lipid transport n=1 Tax=Lacunisphaera limnophila TaxID=1838286 RepID=A0A1D8AQY3_9BACT|nr:hypothetical protein [Lacunisphaera limnophila]AOS43004.1 hypothetical protein Verru16b_00042 [Lacunisphaera limnophila]